MKPIVKTDPQICFGKPQIKGVAVDVIVGRFIAGESVEQLQTDYGMFRFQIEAALRYWLTRKRKRPAHTE